MTICACLRSPSQVIPSFLQQLLGQKGERADARQYIYLVTISRVLGATLEDGRQYKDLNDMERKKVADAVRYDELDYDDVLTQKLDVMDATAIVLCRDNNMPLRVVNMTTPGSFVRAALGEPIGTLVTTQEKG